MFNRKFLDKKKQYPPDKSKHTYEGQTLPKSIAVLIVEKYLIKKKKIYMLQVLLKMGIFENLFNAEL